jgi:ribosomal protein S4E
MIKKVKEGYRVVSDSGRNMGTYRTKEEAERRLRQIEYFKHKK